MVHSPPATILIVDDDRGLARLIEKALRRQGHVAVTAASGKEAIAWLDAGRPDLILLDLKLADMGGREFIERVARSHRQFPFLVITGQGDERVAVEMMKRGALDYLVKDSQFLELLPAVVSRVVKQVEQGRKLAAVEEQMRLIEAAVQQARDAMLISTDEKPEPRIVYANPAFVELTGLAAPDVLGHGLSVLGPVVQDLDRVREALPRGGPLAIETTVTHTSGARRDVEWQLNPVRDRRGRLTHWISIQRDVTARKRLEAELLEVSAREQRRIGQDLHDGLGQHLAGIELMSRVLAQKLAGSDHADAEQAARIGKHVREAIAQTRALARGLSPVALEAQGLMAALQELTASTGALFRVDCAFACDPPVLVEDNQVATQFYRIAQEAITNAVKHGRPRKVLVTLKQAPGQLELSVADDGAGLPAAAPEHAGMGLRIMNYRAGTIGAHLELRRRQPAGTLVVCTLGAPARPAHSED
jgi:PAS domain S-box-containing protein